MKHRNYIKLSKYRSTLATRKRLRSEALFVWLKKQFCKHYGLTYNETT